MNDHDRLRDLCDTIATLRSRIATDGHELIRRARISSRPDGYPARASGAEPGQGVTSTRHDTHVMLRPGGLTYPWSWSCSCGCEGQLYANEYLATRAGEDHANAASSLDYADPTGDAAVATPTPDPLRNQARRLLRHLTLAALELQTAVGCIDRPAPPTDNGDPGCESCARLTRHDGTPYWEPPDPRRKMKTTHGGRLPRAMLLCRWCSDQVGINSETPGRREVLPTRDELATHHAGRNLRRPA